MFKGEPKVPMGSARKGECEGIQGQRAKKEPKLRLRQPLLTTPDVDVLLDVVLLRSSGRESRLSLCCGVVDISSSVY